MKYEFENPRDFLTSLEQDSLLENSEVKFRNLRCDDDFAIIATALKSGKCPQGLQIILWGNFIGAGGVQAIATALESGKCPHELQIHLEHTPIGDVGAQMIAAALQSGQCPQGLHINLGDTNIGAIGAEAIATALQSGQCPQRLHLSLWCSSIGAPIAEAIATALQSGQCPPGLHIDLGSNNMGIVGAKAIAMALQSSQCPQGLQFNLGHNNIGTVGAQFIAMALQSGQCPQGLKVNLWGNNIDAAGVQAIAMALQSSQCPQGLHIGLRYNSIGEVGIKAIVTAILSGKCPPGLCLDGIDELSKHLHITLKMFLEEGQPDWPSILNAIRSIFCYSPNIFLEDNELKQTIQDILEEYIYSLQTSAAETISVEEYRESYLPDLKNIAEVVLVICEKSSDAPDIQKKWANGLMLNLAESILPGPLSHESLSVWARAQRLIFLEKMFSLFPEASAVTFLAHNWQCFCDEFNAVPQQKRIFQPNGDIANIKENAANAGAVAYYTEVLHKGLLVLPEIELTKQVSSTNLSQTVFFQQQQQSFDEEILTKKLPVGQSPAA